MTNPLIRLAIALVVLLAALPAAAQYTQYTEPGSQIFPELPTKERFDLALSESLWRLGKLRVDPWVGVRNAGWVDNVYASPDEPTSDYTITVGAGLHAYTRLGPKVVFAAHALPEYVWWGELEDRRVWNGRYGAGLFGFLNRLRFELSATTGRQNQYLSSEVEQPVNVRRDRGTASLELRLTGHLAVAAAASTTQWRFREEDISGPLGERLLTLDRDEDRLQAGVRYYFSPDFFVGAGVEDIAVDFQRPERDRSSTGTSPSAEVDLRGEHMLVRAKLIFADLEPEPGSGFVPYDDALGRVQLIWRPRAKLQLELYSRSNLVYSMRDDSPYFTDRRLGVAAGMPVGRRMLLRSFVEDGSNEYAAPPGGLQPADEDILAYGLQFSMRLNDILRLQAVVSRTDYSSGDGQFDRDITRIAVGLTLGESTSEWW